MAITSALTGQKWYYVRLLLKGNIRVVLDQGDAVHVESSPETHINMRTTASSIGTEQGVGGWTDTSHWAASGERTSHGELLAQVRWSYDVMGSGEMCMGCFLFRLILGSSFRMIEFWLQNAECGKKFCPIKNPFVDSSRLVSMWTGPELLWKYMLHFYNYVAKK